ncbi:glycoside hydrolase family 43 protein [Salipiger sp. IMCC34102]|uniref:glycoside hydrolase family 43 protein n=1 Tax=Salipiger sp. IMCC34102 TaxID=2510647 RepID=UPI001F5CC212|nr:glycoside hydrolase family 43 protein [Salipiger sp. IMCC34102]
MRISNPILPGFNPDPSIVRVGEEVFIATSTFEWYPGVQIHRSRDLKNWELAARPLDRASLLDMRGNPDSGGVWAPCLTYADGRFWLVYSDMKRRDGAFKDCRNYLTTAPSVEGPWSEPVYLNASGFDASLFHDEDGRKWLVNMIWDHNQTGADRFGGIVIQEYDVGEARLIGKIRNIYCGTDLGLVEGPHLYRRDGFYYLLTAEGGTEFDHAVTMARSRDLFGPYETDPIKHMLTAKDTGPEHLLQRAGHADIVEMGDGSLFMVHLCSRPLPETRNLPVGAAKRDHCRSPLGRETAIQRLVWEPGAFPRLAHGGVAPAAEIDGPELPEAPVEPISGHRTFDAGLPPEFQWLRTPQPERVFSLDARPGHLRIFGRESPGSTFEHALVARRQDAMSCRAETRIDVSPGDYQQFAGLISWYSGHKFHYLAVTADEAGARVLTVYSCPADWPDRTMTRVIDPIALPGKAPIDLGCDVDGARLRFRYRVQDGDWTDAGVTLDQSAISDESADGAGNNFTGAFIGLCAHDTSGRGRHADFDRFSYRATPG